MSNSYFARSGVTKTGIEPQTYRSHVLGVMNRCRDNLNSMLKFSSVSEEQRQQCVSMVMSAAQFHDLGKLDSKNQKVLSGYKNTASLPIPHEDAGCAFFVNEDSKTVRLKNRTEKTSALSESALYVFSHHVGLPNVKKEHHRKNKQFRYLDEHDYDGTQDIQEHVNNHLSDYLLAHQDSLGSESDTELKNCVIKQPTGLQRRLSLSCLVDADFSDAASCSNDFEELSPIPCRWEERLEALEKYIDQKRQASSSSSERQQIRDDVFNLCKDADVTESSMETCCGAVGVGKTTAVMARLLHVAIQRGLRRIFVILPYTQIIKQSIDVYRKALVLPGENPEMIVAEHHHLADFESETCRQYAMLWNSPIVVTTAVQFFETLGSNRPATLRKLHEVPGSAVFIDEAHNAMPLKLWPLEWRWLNELSKSWKCHFVFASGSLIKFWEHESFIPSESKENESKENRILPEIISPELQNSIQNLESQRIQMRRFKDALSVDELIEKLCQQPDKSKLVVLNTVYNAALVASRLRKRLNEKGLDGNNCVMHLSTALSPLDRDNIVNTIKEKLNPQNPKYVPGLILVATCCVEAGVDFSFNMAYREACSVASLFQIAGRVNRNAEMEESGQVYSFRFFQNDEVSINRSFEISSGIVDELFEENWFDDESKTPLDILNEAFERELQRTSNDSERLLKHENNMEYKDVATECKVIPATDTVLVVVNEQIIDKITNHQRVTQREIQMNSVQIWTNKIDKLGLERLDVRPDLYKWTLGEYDSDFLGYMTENTMLLVKGNKDVLVI